MFKRFFVFICSCCSIISCGAENDPQPELPSQEEEATIQWTAAADSSSQALLQHFWNGEQHYFNYNSNGQLDFHYWPQAHALDVLVDAYLRTGDSKYAGYFPLWLEGVKKKNNNGWWNEYFDDMEWNALALLRVYEATHEESYTAAALELWGYIKAGWNDQAGGGIMWKKGQPYSKNACSNGPACILAARLYQIFGNEEDKEWALKIYQWEKSTLFNANNGAIYDNINGDTGKLQEWFFTYNQGTFIGSAVELHQILGEKSYLNDAVRAADYTISTLVSNSILKSEGTGDGGLFKGVFIRYFTKLIQQSRLDRADQRRYLQFLKVNAETLWQQGTQKSLVLFGPDWRTMPTGETGLTEQLSGCMLMEAAALLAKQQLF